MKITIIFDKNSTAWARNNRGYNQAFVTAQVHYLEDLYRHDGYLYFESVYSQLGLIWDPYDENECWIHERDGDLKFNVLSESSSDNIQITIYN